MPNQPVLKGSAEVAATGNSKNEQKQKIKKKRINQTVVS